MKRDTNRTKYSGIHRVVSMMMTLFLVYTVFLPLLPARTAWAAEEAKPLAGKKISIMGDSISTYTGWSDVKPITDASCANRYGEAYYGPTGGDFHNTDLKVTDTWWHQAATELGLEVLVNSSGNSTGVFHADYPWNAAWDQYLKDMLAWKSRPYHLGANGEMPDIIALYIGSNEAGRCAVDAMGSIDDVNLDTLIQKQADGSFTYATPANVAEAYCIMLHKVKTTYPNAEIYCFAVVPNAGSNATVQEKAVNKRMPQAIAFNEMVKGVAEYFDATVVDLFEAFDLKETLTRSEFQKFNSYFNNDPHPNAAGFDVITDCFVSTVLKNTRYTVSVETTGGNFETVGVETIRYSNGERNGYMQKAEDYVTPNGLLVDYRGSATTLAGQVVAAESTYTSDRAGIYHAEGGRTYRADLLAPTVTVEIPVTLTEDGSLPRVAKESTRPAEGPVLQAGSDPRSDPSDGIYDYTVRETKSQGQAEIETKKLEIKEKLGQEDVTSMRFVSSSTVANSTNELIQEGYTPITRPIAKEDVPPIAEGYQFVYVGSDQYSSYYSAHAHEAPLDSFPGESPTYTDPDEGFSLYVGADHAVFKKRNLMVPRMYFMDKIVESVNKFPARWEAIEQFTLSNAEGVLVTTYCADKNTGAETGYSYVIKNLEDANYYTEYDAQKIRAIAKKAYWGAASGYGSLQAFKENLRNLQVLTDEELALVTDGIALTATQYAVWTFSNSMDAIRFINAYYTTIPGGVSRPADKEKTDVLFKIYRYLISVDPEPIAISDPTTENTIITEKYFLKNISFSLKEKPTTVAENLDQDADNDVYRADLSFTLAVQPAEGNNDKLVMVISDDSGNLLARVRIAGAAQPGEIVPESDGKGKYTISDVMLHEGQENIRFYLSGEQELDKDVHLFVSENRGGVTSQTMVGIAEGKRAVNVSLKLGMRLSVTDDLCLEEHVWRTEQQFGGEDVPPTGDGMGLFILAGLALISMLGMVVLKKREQN